MSFFYYSNCILYINMDIINIGFFSQVDSPKITLFDNDTALLLIHILRHIMLIISFLVNKIKSVYDFLFLQYLIIKYLIQFKKYSERKLVSIN